MSDFKDHFSSQAAAYATYRPAYPASLIADLVARAPGRALAWDCATGNGQAAHLLAAHMERVVATDASRDQIAHAIPHERVEYRVAREDGSGLPDSSVDIVTVAAALHWLDLDRFYPEVHRVLKPRGVLAVWTYGLAVITPPIDAIFRWFAYEHVGAYWPPERVHVDRGYRDLSFPYGEIDIGPREISATLSREQFLGYVATWSAVARARAREEHDPMALLRQRLTVLWPDSGALSVRWPLHVRVGKRDAGRGGSSAVDNG